MQQESQTLSSVPLAVCSICSATEPLPWFEQEMNEEIRAYARSYISPVKQFYPSMEAQTAVWGTTIQPEDLLL